VRVAEGEALRDAMVKRDTQASELASKISTEEDPITRNVVHHMVKGITRISEQRKARIAAALKLSVDDIWPPLARGGLKSGGAASGVLIREPAGNNPGNVSRIDDASSFAMTAAISRWRSASAGHQGGDGSFMQDGYKEVQVAFLVGGPSKIDRHAVVDVSGNSMMPRVNSGESLIIYKDEILYRNSIVLAKAPPDLGGETFVKALRWVDNMWQLHSVNKADGQDFLKLDDWEIYGYAICRFGDDTEDEQFNVEWRNGRPLRAIRSLAS
jgi:hypothetical protein